MCLSMFYRGLACSMFLNVVNSVGIDILNVGAVYFTSRATAGLKPKTERTNWNEQEGNESDRKRTPGTVAQIGRGSIRRDKE